MERSIPDTGWLRSRQPPTDRGTAARLDRLLASAEIAIAATALVIGLLVSLYAIVARALLRPTAEWVLELPMELLVVAAIYGSGALVSRRQHLTVDLIVQRLSLRWRRALDLAIDATVGLFCAVLAVLAASAAAEASRAGLHSPELFNLSSAVPLAVASAGFALWSLHLFMRLLVCEGEG